MEAFKATVDLATNYAQEDFQKNCLSLSTGQVDILKKIIWPW